MLIRHANPQPVNALWDRTGSTFLNFNFKFLKEPSKVKPCRTECYVRTAVTRLLSCAPLSRRRPDGSAWRAACVKTTTRSGSCFISSMLWYSCCCSKRSSKQPPRTILDFPQRRWVTSSFLIANRFTVPFYINVFFTWWMDTLICMNRRSCSCNSSCYLQFCLKDVFTPSCFIKAAFFFPHTSDGMSPGLQFLHTVREH